MITFMLFISEWLNLILYYVQNFFRKNNVDIINSNYDNLNHNQQQPQRQPQHQTTMNNQSYENIISLTFNYAWNILTHKIDHNFIDMKKNVLKSELVTKTLEKLTYEQFIFNNNNRNNDDNRQPQQQHQSNNESIKYSEIRNTNEFRKYLNKNRLKAFNIFENLTSLISLSLLRIANWILYRILSRMFNCIQFNRSQLEQIRQKQQQHEPQQQTVSNNNNNRQQQQQQQQSPNKSKMPILYLLIRKSYIDCLLITFILSMNGFCPPLIALNRKFSRSSSLHPFFMNLIRGFGAFIVNFNNNHGTNHNDSNKSNDSINLNENSINKQIHNAILRSYIIENLRLGNSLEFFLDNSNLITTPSTATIPTTAKMPTTTINSTNDHHIDDDVAHRFEFNNNQHKNNNDNSNLLSIVIDALADGSIQNVCIVPVSISYEKSIEPIYNGDEQKQLNYQSNHQKQQQQQNKSFVAKTIATISSTKSILLTIWKIWKTIRTNYGTVRVDFCQPFILNDYMNQFQLHERLQKQFDNKLQSNYNQLNASDNNNDNNCLSNESIIPTKIDYGISMIDCIACTPPSQSGPKMPSKCISANGDGHNENQSIQKLIIKQSSMSDDDEDVLENNNADNSTVDSAINRLKCCQSLSKHILYDLYQNQSIMSTHLIAFLLLNKYRTQGTTIKQLSLDLDWLRQTIYRYKSYNDQHLQPHNKHRLQQYYYKLSTSLINNDSYQLIKYAIKLLRNDNLINIEKLRIKWSSPMYNDYDNGFRNSYSNNKYNYYDQTTDKDFDFDDIIDNCDNDDDYQYNQEYNKSKLEIIYLKPVINLQSLLHLQHYSNHCSSLFIFESVLSISLHSFVQKNIELSSLLYDPSTFISNLSINKREFFRRCRLICSLLQNEFIFTKNCQSLDQMLVKTFIESFYKRDIFVLNPNKQTGLTLPMSDVTNHCHHHHHHHRHHHHYYHNHNNNSTSVNSMRLSNQLGDNCKDKQSHHHKSQRRRRKTSSLFKNFDGKLQNQCILEVDEDRLNDNDDDDLLDSLLYDQHNNDLIIDLIIDCINDYYHTLRLNIIDFNNHGDYLNKIDSNLHNNSQQQQQQHRKHQYQLPQEFYIRLTEKNCQLLSLYRSILEPYLQSYWFVSDKLTNYYYNNQRLHNNNNKENQNHSHNNRISNMHHHNNMKNDFQRILILSSSSPLPSPSSPSSNINTTSNDNKNIENGESVDKDSNFIPSSAESLPTLSSINIDHNNNSNSSSNNNIDNVNSNFHNLNNDLNNQNNDHNNNIINVDEKLFLKLLSNAAKQAANNGHIYHECASIQTFRNALKFFSTFNDDSSKGDGAADEYHGLKQHNNSNDHHHHYHPNGRQHHHHHHNHNYHHRTKKQQQQWLQHYNHDNVEILNINIDKMKKLSEMIRSLFIRIPPFETLK